MKEYPEWDYGERAYSRTAGVKVNKFRERDAQALASFNERYESLAIILSRGLGHFRSRRKNIERRTKKAGRINQRYVVNEFIRAQSGQELTERIYDRKTNPDQEQVKLGMSMGLLLDQSGSTRFKADSQHGYRRIDLIKFAALTIGRSISRVDDGFFVYAFHSYGDDGGNPTIMEELKKEGDIWDRTIEERIAALEHTANGDWYNNKDGAAIRFANEQVLKSPFSSRFIFMVTDGSPNCDGTYYRGRTAREDTRKAMEEGNQQGIKYVYLTINPDSDAESFMELINPQTVFGRRYSRMRDIVPGLTEAYGLIKARRF